MSPESCSDPKPAVHASPCGGIFIWNAAGADKLRRKCRIIGQAIGCLTRCPRQNNLLGLPILLSLEEAVLILWKDLAEFYIDTAIHEEKIPPLNQEKIDLMETLKQQNHTEISEVIAGQKQIERVGHYHQIVSGKEKRKERLLKKREKGEYVSDSELAECDEKFVDLWSIPGSSVEAGDVPSHIPTATPQVLTREGEMNRINSDDLSFCESFDRLFHIMKCDKKQYQRFFLRCRVFCDLWMKGYFVTVSTFKMAGDFLIYQGDPVIHHASHIVLIESSTEGCTVHQLSSNLRVATSVRKVLLIASEQEGELKYTSLNWAGV